MRKWFPKIIKTVIDERDRSISQIIALETICQENENKPIREVLADLDAKATMLCVKAEGMIINYNNEQALKGATK